MLCTGPRHTNFRRATLNSGSFRLHRCWRCLENLSSLPTGFRINWLISYISSLESREEFETGWPGCVRIVGSEVIQFDGLSANRRLRADDTP
jgi:hypothetical protein